MRGPCCRGWRSAKTERQHMSAGRSSQQKCRKWCGRSLVAVKTCQRSARTACLHVGGRRVFVVLSLATKSASVLPVSSSPMNMLSPRWPWVPSNVLLMDGTTPTCPSHFNNGSHVITSFRLKSQPFPHWINKATTGGALAPLHSPWTGNGLDLMAWLGAAWPVFGVACFGVVWCRVARFGLAWLGWSA